MKCSKCGKWEPAGPEMNGTLNARVGGKPKNWGRCGFEHCRAYVDTPAEAGSGVAPLYTAESFGCVEFAPRGKRG